MTSLPYHSRGLQQRRGRRSRAGRSTGSPGRRGRVGVDRREQPQREQRRASGRCGAMAISSAEHDDARRAARGRSARRTRTRAAARGSVGERSASRRSDCLDLLPARTSAGSATRASRRRRRSSTRRRRCTRRAPLLGARTAGAARRTCGVGADASTASVRRRVTASSAMTGRSALSRHPLVVISSSSPDVASARRAPWLTQSTSGLSFVEQHAQLVAGAAAAGNWPTTDGALDLDAR